MFLRKRSVFQTEDVPRFGLIPGAPTRTGRKLHWSLQPPRSERAQRRGPTLQSRSCSTRRITCDPHGNAMRIG